MSPVRVTLKTGQAPDDAARGLQPELGDLAGDVEGGRQRIRRRGRRLRRGRAGRPRWGRVGAPGCGGGRGGGGEGLRASARWRAVAALPFVAAPERTAAGFAAVAAVAA